MPLLYVNELASAAQLALDATVDQRIRDAIDRLLARQGSNGSFGLWTAGGEDVVARRLRHRLPDPGARARLPVPDSAFRLALDRLRNFVANAEAAAKDGGGNLAYALYVLARNGAAPVGDLRYFADARLDDIATPIAKAQIAAALAMLGDRVRAERVYAAALASIAPQPALEYGRTDYGSVLRDAAALVTLASEGGGRAPHHHRRGRARGGGAQAHALHLDPGECVDGAGGARARQGGADRVGSRSAASARRERSTAACAPAICGSRSG